VRFAPIALLLGCSTEVPPADPPGAASDRLAVSTVQDPDATDRPEVGSRVTLDGVIVTAVDTYDETGDGDIGTIYVQDPAGGPFSGIAVFAPSVSGEPLRVGDVVQVIGELAEFELGQIDPAWADDTGRTVTQLVSASARWTGEWTPPEPTVVDVADLASDPTAETWEGVLVRVEGARATAPTDDRGAFPIAEGLEVDDDLHGLGDVASGTTFAELTGVVSYIYDYKLLPRGPEDVVR